jgi:hypothetical protein
VVGVDAAPRGTLATRFEVIVGISLVVHGTHLGTSSRCE